MSSGVNPPFVATTVVEFGTLMYDAVFCDVAAQLGSGQAIGTPVPAAVLTQDGSQQSVPAALVGVPTVSGTKLVQVIDGSKLTAGAAYNLTFQYLPTPGDVPGQRQMAIQPLVCLY